MTVFWDIATCSQPSGRTTTENDNYYQELLNTGWEPFAVSVDEGVVTVWFRMSHT